MTPYYIAFFWYFLVLAIGTAAKSLRISSFIMMLPLAILACLRGMVGTDTAFYMGLFDFIYDQDFLVLLFEPLFSLTAYLGMYYFEDAHTLLLAMAFVTTVALLSASLRLEGQPALFLTIIVPYFYLDMTMNAIRFGLSFGVAMWAVLFLTQGRTKWFIALAVIASQIHISSVFLTAGVWVFLEARLKTAITLTALSGIGFIFVAEYLSDKIGAYSEIQTSSQFSGLSTFLIGFLVIFLLYIDPAFDRKRRLRLLAMFLISVGFLLLSQISYAGLRFLGLIMPLTYLYASAVCKMDGKAISQRTLTGLYFTAIAAVMFRFRNYSSVTVDYISSPFSPYHFFWEITK